MCFVGQPAERVGLTGSAQGRATKGECKVKTRTLSQNGKGCGTRAHLLILSLGHSPKSRGELFWIGPATTPFSSVDTCRTAP